MTNHYTQARLHCEGLDVYAGQVEDGERSADVLGVLLAGAAQARATLAVADELRRIAESLDNLQNDGSLHVAVRESRRGYSL